MLFVAQNASSGILPQSSSTKARSSIHAPRAIPALPFTRPINSDALSSKDSRASSLTASYQWTAAKNGNGFTALSKRNAMRDDCEVFNPTNKSISEVLERTHSAIWSNNGHQSLARAATMRLSRQLDRKDVLIWQTTTFRIGQTITSALMMPTSAANRSGSVTSSHTCRLSPTYSKPRIITRTPHQADSFPHTKAITTIWAMAISGRTSKPLGLPPWMAARIQTPRLHTKQPRRSRLSRLLGHIRPSYRALSLIYCA